MVDQKETQTTTEAPKKEEAAPAPNPEFEALKAKNAELEQIARGAIKKAEDSETYVSQLVASLQTAAERATTPQVDPNVARESLAERMAQDPASVLDEHFRIRSGPLVAGVADTQAKINERLAMMKFEGEKIKGTDVSLAVKYGDEVKEFMKNLPSDTRAQADAWDAAMRWVRSQHIDDEVELRNQSRVEAEKRAFTEGPTSSRTHTPAKRELNEVEKTLAKGLGVSEEDWLTYKEAANE